MTSMDSEGEGSIMVASLAASLYVAVFALQQMYIWRNRREPSLAKRQFGLVLVSNVLWAVVGTTTFFRFFAKRKLFKYYVFVEMLGVGAIVSARNVVFIIRCLLLMHEEHVNMVMLSYSQLEQSAGSVSSKICTPPRFNRLEILLIILMGLGRRQNGRPPVPNFSSKIITRAVLIWTAAFICLVGLVILFPAIQCKLGGSCTLPKYTRIMFLAVFGAQLPFTLFNPYFLWRVRGLQDTYLMRAEIFITVCFDTLCLVLVPTFYLHQNQDGFFRRSNYAFMLVLGVTCALCNVLSFLSNFLTIYSTHRHRRREPVTKSLESIYATPKLWAKFKTRLARDFSMENAIFTEVFDRLAAATRQPTNTTLPTARFIEPQQAETQRGNSANGAIDVPADYIASTMEYLVNTFVREGAEHELNISCEVRELLTEHARRGKLCIEHFLVVRNEVWQSMLQNSYPRYLREIRG